MLLLLVVVVHVDVDVDADVDGGQDSRIAWGRPGGEKLMETLFGGTLPLAQSFS